MKFELHTHTSENDICVDMSAAEIVAAYHQEGYRGIVITNHLFDLSREWYKAELSGRGHDAIIDYYLKGYRLAREAGGRLGMTVLLGMELRFDGTVNDYLVYGFDEDFLYRSPLLNTLDLDSFLKILPGKALVYQAHPFRDGMSVTDPSKLFGIEVYNGGTDAVRNRFADFWADLHGLRKISGSDFHSIRHLARGGVDFDCEVFDNDSLIRQLLDNSYTLIRTS